MKIVIVTNGPVPYRIPALNELAAMPDIDLHVIFCCAREPNRNWGLPPMEFRCTYLSERIIQVKDRYIHNNPDVIGALRKARPDVVITSGFNPTHLYAFAYARLKRLPHIAMTDGTYDSEQSLSVVHRWVRQHVFARSTAFVWASKGGRKLFASYGITDSRCFRACLCVENSKFADFKSDNEGQYDFIFTGRFEHGKNPHFALDVAIETARKLGRRTSILFVGTGSEEPGVRAQALAHQDLVEATFYGFATQDSLPGLYRSARIFLFPTRWDAWGVVANEACAAGLPVLISPHAGAAGELVVDGHNGYVSKLDVDLWAEQAMELLTNPETYRTFADHSRNLVSRFTFKDACDGIMAACRYATQQHQLR